MAMISQKDQLALHEFSMRIREAVSVRSAGKDQNMEVVKEAVTEQYHAEQDAKIQSSEEAIEPPKEPEGFEPEH